MDIYLIPSANAKQIWHPFFRPHHQSTSNLLVFSFVFDAEALVQDNVPQELIIFIQVRSRVEFFQRGLGKQHCFVTSLQAARNRTVFVFLNGVYVCASLFNHTFYNQIKQTQNAIRRCRQTVHHNNNVILKCCLQAKTHWWALNMTQRKNTELGDKNSLTFFKGLFPFEWNSAAEPKRC